jgi:sugar phosphate isomerase/epimerase
MSCGLAKLAGLREFSRLPMKNILFSAVFPLVAAAAFAGQPSVDFHDHLGLQMWSLRDVAKTDVVKSLDITQGYGFTEIETGKPTDRTVEQYADELRQRGLVAVGIHTGYDTLTPDGLKDVIHTARALGAHYVTCPWITHPKEGFTEAQAHKVAKVFNAAGAACKAAGLQFCYHTHGYEFTPSSRGEGDTVFDVLMRETTPGLVEYEMDVFWTYQGGGDPVGLLNKYPDRWLLMHIKDLRKGAPKGVHTGSAPATDNVPVGKGEIDWSAVLRTAEKVGVQYYFVEDETPNALESIPISLAYLRGLKL